MSDKYVYPGTEVLINKFNIKNSEELVEVERRLTSLKYQDIREGKIKINKTFDYEHLKSLHKELFKER